MPASAFIAHCRKSDGAQQGVSHHLEDVSVLAGIYASKIGLGPAGELIGLLHDLGKYSQAFQNYLKSAEGVIDPDADEYVDAGALRGSIDHSTAGAQYVRLGPYAGQVLALCIASHHSGLIDCLSGNAVSLGEDISPGA